MSAVAETSLRIGGMHCAACADLVEDAVRRQPGVVDVRVSAAAQCACVRWNPALTDARAIGEAVRSAGYEASPDTFADARAARLRESRLALWRLFVAAFCAMQIMMLAAPAYFSAPGELSAEYKRLLDWGSWLLSLPVLCFAAAPFFGGAWRALRQARIGMDVPVALGIAVAFVASTGAAFAPGGAFGSEVFFDSMSMFISFLLAGRYLETRARHRAERSLEEVTSGRPDVVQREQADGTILLVAVDLLAPGDRIRVPYGEAFVVDGTVVAGWTQADESLLTGESRPVAKREGDAVIAGSLNVGGPVTVRAERVGADTRAEAIAALMRAARSQRPAAAAMADRWAGPFLWTVLLLAAGAGAAWSAIDPSRAVAVVVAVLVVTCPCALSLAVPSALLSATAAMARHGLLLRNLDAITGLARVRTLFVDKTGTLTDGKMHCIRVRHPDGAAHERLQLLASTASSLAAWSTHPLSRALHDAFPADGTTWTALREVPGQGIEGLDPFGRQWQLGSAGWVGGPSRLSSATGQVCLSTEQRLVAVFEFEERLRDDAPDAVTALHAQGVRINLLSGDDPERAIGLGQRLALDSARGGMTPEAKLEALRAAQQAGEQVTMIGDGVNDAPVLAQADVSIAMGEGALVARTQADAVLVSNRLGDVARARALAQRTVRIVRQNLAWAALYNLSCVPLALTGHLPPWAAGLGMACSSLFVVANSLRLAR
ncbi:MAG: heavy metal translocating P-type ATPase [Vitreoscilla sp.]